MPNDHGLIEFRRSPSVAPTIVERQSTWSSRSRSASRGRPRGLRRPVGLRQDHGDAHGRRSGSAQRGSDCAPGPGDHGAQPGEGHGIQACSSFPWLTVFGNVRFGLKYRRGVPAVEKDRIARHYLELVKLTPFADFYVNRISGGMRQRAIARTLAADPLVLLMDEPFGALDALTRERLQLQLLDLQKAERKTVIFVTHDVDEAVSSPTGSSCSPPGRRVCCAICGSAKISRPSQPRPSGELHLSAASPGGAGADP